MVPRARTTPCVPSPSGRLRSTAGPRGPADVDGVVLFPCVHARMGSIASARVTDVPQVPPTGCVAPSVRAVPRMWTRRPFSRACLHAWAAALLLASRMNADAKRYRVEREMATGTVVITDKYDDDDRDAHDDDAEDNNEDDDNDDGDDDDDDDDDDDNDGNSDDEDNAGMRMKGK